MSRAASNLPARLRAVVLRSRQPSALGVLRERAERRALLLPAGPYLFPFAAALELARLFHGNDLPFNQDAAGLSRAALAQSLRGLALSEAHVVAPRLDWLDASSLDLLCDLLEAAELLGSGLRLTGGMPASTPAPGLARLLALARCADERFDEPRARALNVHEKALLATLRAAPLPLAPEALMRASGLRERDFAAALRTLSAAGYADAGPRVGLGAASEILPVSNLTRWREALLDGCALPDARLCLEAALGLAGPEGARMAHDALAQGEAALALHRFELAPRKSAHDYLTQGLALALCGRHEAARAIFDAHHARGLARARLAAELCRAGHLGRASCDAALRQAEREERGHAGEVEAVTLRGELMLRAKQNAAALKLLRRIPAAQAHLAPPNLRAAYLAALAGAWHACAKGAKAKSVIESARLLALPPAVRLRLEQCARHCGAGDAAREIACAAQALDLPAARQAMGQAGAAGVEMFKAALAPQPAVLAGPPPPATFEEAFALFARHGATIVAAMDEGRLRVLPAHAAARPGLCAWLEAQLVRVQKSPAAWLVPLELPPGEFGGDFLLLFPALAKMGAVLAVFARPADCGPLLKLAKPRDVVQHWLAQGALSGEELRELLDEITGEHTSWPTSAPSSPRSDEPLTSR